MIERIASTWSTVIVYLSMGLFTVLLLLFVFSCIWLVIWAYNWPVFVFSGMGWGSFLPAAAYVWLCVTYYQPFADWMPTTKNPGTHLKSQIPSGPIAVDHAGNKT
ncbi:MAG: hypothetical protein Q8M93_00610 [Polaromonas sp.]|uniref:hypothetical protein n=1 Tax=Polaromonas sp. TaxID=1869339 RepID=UPI00272F0035|nr:hypothetical protein [Polaromonas sp.]MDP2448519.1 hypothetical protein [Polaromonas sp.]MDP3245453.1 hypothetical protein [Polaromonas sp.]MDP3754940.1 hypothetical protein [Polaromonas sp.]